MPASDRFLDLASSGTPREARAVVEGMGLRAGAPAGRPRVVAVMIAAPDGRATVDGRSGGLGSPADRDVLRAMRAEADVLFVGSGTMRAERYGSLLDDEHRALRVAGGLPPTLRVATVSRDLATLPIAEARIFSEPGAPVTVFTTSTQEAVPAPAVAADLEVVRFTPDAFDRAAVLHHLQEAHGARLVVTEGGPTLLRGLVSVGLLDDLLHTVAPFLVAGDGPTLLMGDALPEPARLQVRSVHRAGDHLFVHYVVAR